MSLLDDLKKKAAAKEAALAASQAAATRLGEFRAVALPAMFRIHQNLSELVHQLQVLDEQAPARLNIPGVGLVDGFLQGRYELAAEGMPPETVTLRCELRQRREQALEMTTGGLDATAWLDRLRRHGMLARIVREGDAGGRARKTCIAIQGSIPALLRFSLDPDNGALQLVSHNFEEIGERRQVFGPAVVTEPWCEELLKYVLRRDNTFLRDEIPQDMRERLRQRIEWERTHGRGATPRETSAFGIGAMLRIVGRKPDAPPPLEHAGQPDAEPREAVEESADNRVASSATIRKLLKPRPTLMLRHAARRFDLAHHDGPFIIGRSPDSDLHVAEKHVSKVHARIEVIDGSYVITDDSRNGTYVYFDDGRWQRLRGECAALTGSGRLSLGTRPTADEDNVIHFSA